MKYTSAILTALLAALASAQNKVPGNNPLTFCTDHSHAVHIDNVDFTPNPPVKAHKLTISANGTATKPVQRGAYIDLKVEYGFFPVIHEKVDLCQQLEENFGISCPSKEIAVSKDVEIPSSVPDGRYKLRADARMADGSRLTCLESTLTF